MENKDGFLKRADSHIALANKQISDITSSGEVSASFMYGMTRFNAWIAACEFSSAEDMEAEKEKIVEYFSNEYKKMLEEHIDNHIQHFDFSK